MTAEREKEAKLEFSELGTGELMHLSDLRKKEEKGLPVWHRFRVLGLSLHVLVLDKKISEFVEEDEAFMVRVAEESIV